MCIIIDANCKDDYLNGADYLKPVIKWLNNGGRLAFAKTKKFQKEMGGDFLNVLRALRADDKLEEANAADVEKQQKKLAQRGDLKSDDPHILALALVTKTKLLVTKDENLEKDFKNKNIIKGGNIYKYANRDHKRLLDRSCCP